MKKSYNYNGEYSDDKRIEKFYRTRIKFQIKHNVSVRPISIVSVVQHFLAGGELAERIIEAEITPEHFLEKKARRTDIQIILSRIFKILNKTKNKKIPTNKVAQAKLREGGYEEGTGYDRGHIVAESQGETNHPVNIIPMKKIMNRGYYSLLEKAIRDDITKNKVTYHSTYTITFGDIRSDSKGSSSTKQIRGPLGMIISSVICNDKRTVFRYRIDFVDFIKNLITTITADEQSGGMKNIKIDCPPQYTKAELDIIKTNLNIELNNIGNDLRRYLHEVRS